MTPFQCGHCGQAVFFDNHSCTQCGAQLAYHPERRAMLALPPGGQAVEDGQTCANRFTAAVCNWLVTDAPATQCRSCRLTRLIPDLSVPGHAERWRRVELAKRRVVYSLIGMGLTPEPQQGPDDRLGLSFELLAPQPGGPRVLTGHDDGVITLNIDEADDVAREMTRVAMGEPVRSLLGHLRHEVSHYLQYRWLRTPEAEGLCREVFGDERRDYAAALARHHAEGAPADWAQHYISAYASAHPWEDWAETCAHVLLVADALETAARWGLQLQGHAPTGALPEASVLDAAVPPGPHPVSFSSQVLQHWLPIAGFVNAMNRSLGVPDAYPYLMPNPVLHKMDTVQALLASAAAHPMPMTSSSSIAPPSPATLAPCT